MTRWCCWELKDSGSLCCSENPHASVAVLMQPPSTCINGAMPRKDSVPFKWAVQIHRAHRKNTSHVAEDVSCLVQKAPSRCSTQIAAPHQMPIGIYFWTTLHPKDCHTTDQKYKLGLGCNLKPCHIHQGLIYSFQRPARPLSASECHLTKLQASSSDSKHQSTVLVWASFSNLLC